MNHDRLKKRRPLYYVTDRNDDKTIEIDEAEFFRFKVLLSVWMSQLEKVFKIPLILTNLKPAMIIYSPEEVWIGLPVYITK